MATRCNTIFTVGENVIYDNRLWQISLSLGTPAVILGSLQELPVTQYAILY